VLLGIVGVLSPDVGLFAASAEHLDNDHQDAHRGEEEQAEDCGEPETTVAGAPVPAGRAAGCAVLIGMLLHNY